MAPRLIIAANSQSFDRTIISNWQNEGFDVRFEPVRDDTRPSIRSIEYIGDTLEDGETYALIAYGPAATIMLRHAFYEPFPKLCALIAYYPSHLPDPASTPPKSLRVQVHLAGDQPFAPKYPYYTYAGTSPGFDQRESGCFDKIASDIAWSRALDCVHRGFGIEADIESIWDDHMAHQLIHKDPTATLKAISPNQPALNHIPAITGGVGTPEVSRFYRDFFIPCNPPSLVCKLLSRTVGSDRIVDEMLLTFTHSCEMPWILPGVLPTNRRVEIVVVCVVCVRGGKVQSENLHWDQASVLVQVGLLDAKLGAVGLGREGGVNVLPVSGAEAARKVADPEGVRSNGMIPSW